MEGQNGDHEEGLASLEGQAASPSRLLAEVTTLWKSKGNLPGRGGHIQNHGTEQPQVLGNSQLQETVAHRRCPRVRQEC